MLLFISLQQLHICVDKSPKRFCTFCVALYFLILLVQLLLGNQSYLKLLEDWYVVVLLHGVILINTFFLINGIKYYHEDVGAE